MKDKVLDIRFIVPPILLILFTALLSPSQSLTFFKGQVNISADATVAVLGITTLLGLGFIISSIVEYITSSLRWRASNYNCNEIDILKNKLDSLFEKEPTETELELASWIVMDKTGEKTNGHIRDQIHKRWNMAMANFSCALALLLAAVANLVFLCIGKITFHANIWPWPVFYFLFSLVLIKIFWRNGQEARKSVGYLDRALVRYWKSQAEKDQKNREDSL